MKQRFPASIRFPDSLPCESYSQPPPPSASSISVVHSPPIEKLAASGTDSGPLPPQARHFPSCPQVSEQCPKPGPFSLPQSHLLPLRPPLWHCLHPHKSQGPSESPPRCLQTSEEWVENGRGMVRTLQEECNGNSQKAASDITNRVSQ